MPKTHTCQAGEHTTLVKNIAARGLAREFTLESKEATGTVEVTSSFLPFFLLTQTKRLPFTSGMKVQRGFFDATFEIAAVFDHETKITIS